MCVRGNSVCSQTIQLQTQSALFSYYSLDNSGSLTLIWILHQHYYIEICLLSLTTVITVVCWSPIIPPSKTSFKQMAIMWPHQSLIGLSWNNMIDIVRILLVIFHSNDRTNLYIAHSKHSGTLQLPYCNINIQKQRLFVFIQCMSVYYSFPSKYSLKWPS